MELEEFKENCKNKKCLRRMRYDEKTCVRNYKQENCYKSFERLEAKKQIKYEENKEQWEEQAEFDKEVWLRYTGETKGKEAKREKWQEYCRIWKILTSSERKHLENTCEDLWTNRDLDIAHIKPKSVYIKDKYNIENVVLIGRFFHRRLTDMRHPVTGELITNPEVTKWLESARDKKRYI